MRSTLITPAGRQKLQDEFTYLWKVKRPAVTQAVSEAAALGDRSENAEYKEGKRMLRAIDSRVRFLMKRLEQVKVVEYSPQQEGKVYFGAYVRLQNDQDEVLICRIVGSDEIDTEKKHITIDSPMARALLGKEEGDEIAVTTPTGVKYWEVIDIRYRPFDSLEV